MFPFVRKFKICQKSFADITHSMFDPSSLPTKFYAEHFHNLNLIEIQIENLSNIRLSELTF